MGTYAWNILYSKILPSKSQARRRRPTDQAAPSQVVHRNLATGPIKYNLIAVFEWCCVLQWMCVYVRTSTSYLKWWLCHSSICYEISWNTFQRYTTRTTTHVNILLQICMGPSCVEKKSDWNSFVTKVLKIISKLKKKKKKKSSYCHAGISSQMPLVTYFQFIFINSSNSGEEYYRSDVI